MKLTSGNLAVFQFPTKEVIGVTQAFEKGRKKGGQCLGIFQEEGVEFLRVHQVKAGGFKGPGAGRAGLFIQQGHFPKNISNHNVTEGGVGLPRDMDGDFDSTGQDLESFGSLFAFTEDPFPLGVGFFTHPCEGDLRGG